MTSSHSETSKKEIGGGFQWSTGTFAYKGCGGYEYWFLMEPVIKVLITGALKGENGVLLQSWTLAE